MSDRELWAQISQLEQQLAERDTALAQEHVIAGEAMAWVEFLREPLAAIIAASDAQEWEAWEKGMERARAALAECDPGKPGPARPRPLKEAEAALAGMRQALLCDETIRRYADECGYLEVWRSWRDHMLEQGRHVPEHRMRAETLPQEDVALDQGIAYDLVRDFTTWVVAGHHVDANVSHPGRDRLALERDLYQSVATLRREFCKIQCSSCHRKDICDQRAYCEQADAVLAKCSEAGLP